MTLELRPLTVADWEAVHEWARREDVCRYQAWGPNTPEQTRSFVQAAVEAWSQRPQTRFVYAITLGSRVVGNAELRLHGNRQGEIASARVLAKIGMTFEGRLRETLLIRDGWRDSDLYAILEAEFRPDPRTDASRMP